MRFSDSTVPRKYKTLVLNNRVMYIMFFFVMLRLFDRKPVVNLYTGRHIG